MDKRIEKNIFVNEVMLTCEQFPIVRDDEMFRETLEIMNIFKLGITCIVNNKNKLLGVITDGDIRRILLSEQKPLGSLFVDDIIDYSSQNFKYVHPEENLNNAIKIMGKNKIWDLPVVNKQKTLIGLLHLHPALTKVLEKEKYN